MKIVVCGGGGYIGSRLVAEARKRADVVSTSSSGKSGALPLDLAQPDAFDYSVLDADDVVMLTAAISSPDVCADDKPRAWNVNVTGTSRFMARAFERGARVLFFSSDTVYGERDHPAGESAPCHPAGAYAEMKHAVEQRFAQHALFKAARLSYVFAREDKFTSYLAACARKEEAANVYDPFIRSVVHRDDVVAAALSLAQGWDRFPQRFFNFGGPEAISRIAYADTLRRIAWPTLKTKVVRPDDSFFANRPRSIHMLSPTLADLLGRPASTFEAAATLEFCQ